MCCLRSLATKVVLEKLTSLAWRFALAGGAQDSMLPQMCRVMAGDVVM